MSYAVFKTLLRVLLSLPSIVVDWRLTTSPEPPQAYAWGHVPQLPPLCLSGHVLGRELEWVGVGEEKVEDRQAFRIWPVLLSSGSSAFSLIVTFIVV